MASFFEPYVRQWLLNTESKTEQWVEAVCDICFCAGRNIYIENGLFQAIAADKFEAEGSEGHSSSIVDLFDSLRSPINFLQDLEWTDQYQEARFFTHLSKVRPFGCG